MPASLSHMGDSALLQTIWSQKVNRYELANGATLILKPDHRAALASVQIWVKTGSMHEGALMGAGLSHFLEHMLFKGTGQRDGRTLVQEVQAMGGLMNAYTTYDRTVYHIDLPSEHAVEAIELLADMVSHSTLPAEEIESERNVILREIAMVQDDPDQRFGELLLSSAFKRHPYRHPIIGHRELFAATTREQLLDYYHTRYAPENLVVVVVGAIEEQAVKTAVENNVGIVPRRSVPPVWVPPEPVQLGPREGHAFEKVEVCRVALAWPIPGLGHKDAPALDLLALILGHGDSSLLWQELREKKRLVHSIDAAAWNPDQTGLFSITLTCEAAQREAAVLAVEELLARLLRSGFSSAQIRQAVRQLVVDEINSRKTVTGQATRLGLAEVVAGDLHHARGYFEDLDRMRPLDLRRVLAAYLCPRTRTYVSINPEAALPADGDKGRVARVLQEERLTLPNGVRLILQSDRSLPNVHFRVCCEGGPRFERPNQRGSTALLATMLTKDTRRHTAAAVARRIESAGGAFYPFSGNNSFGLALEVMPSDTAQAHETLADALLEPAFKPRTLMREREAQAAGLRESNDDVIAWGARRMRELFYGDHAFAVGPKGREADVACLTAADLRGLCRSLVVGGNVVFVVAGDFDPKVMKHDCRLWLSKLPRGGIPAPAAAFTSPATVAAVVERQPRQQAVVYEAYPAPDLAAEDFHVGEVVDELMSGMSSRLFERVRDDLGLAYFVRSSRIIGREAGLFCFLAGTEPGKEEAVFREFRAEIARLAHGRVTLQELRRCQNRLRAAHREGLQTNAARAMQLGLDALYGFPPAHGGQYDQKIEAVTVERIKDFAKQYLRPEQRLRFTVAP